MGVRRSSSIAALGNFRRGFSLRRGGSFVRPATGGSRLFLQSERRGIVVAMLTLSLMYMLLFQCDYIGPMCTSSAQAPRLTGTTYVRTGEQRKTTDSHS